MIKIKMTYDEEHEKETIIEAIRNFIIIERVLNIPDERRKRMCIWGKVKEMKR